MPLSFGGRVDKLATMTEGIPPETRTRALRVDRYFRWRGQDVTRLEAFSDAAFAFALTYLVVSSAAPQNVGELRATLTAFVPFALTFAILMFVWFDHYLFFRRFGLRDGMTTLLNSLLLFVVLFFIFPLKFMFSFLMAQIMRDGVLLEKLVEGGPLPLMVFYSGGYAATYLIFVLLYLHAWCRRDDLQLDAAERSITRGALESSTILFGFGVASIVLDLAGKSALAGQIYFGIGPAMAVHGFWRGSKTGRLAKQRSGAQWFD